MPGEILELDPVSEDAANVALTIVDNTTMWLMGHDYPDPDLDSMYASSVDTEGDPLAELRYRNRQISVSLRVARGTAADLETTIAALQQKVGKINRERGTLKRTLPSTDTVIFDLLSARMTVSTGKRFISDNRAEVSLMFEALPFARGTAETLTLRSESTLPALVFTETAIKGDVPALGKLVVNEAQAQDQFWLMWGLQSRYYSSSADAALYYEAEGRTAQGGSASAAGPTGASGAGSNVMRNTALGSAYQSVLSTQATGSGNHLAHVGDFQVWARVQAPTTNTGTVSLALEWAEGDFRKVTQNTGQTITTTLTGSWRLLDLGQVHLSKVVAGTQRWEGRVLAKSTVAGDDVDIDCLFLLPVTEASGQVQGVPAVASPTTFTARDEFDQTAGALSGKTAPVGGAWTTLGGATDFSVETTGKTAQRATVSDGASRFAISGASAFAGQAVHVDYSMPFTTANVINGGLLARYVDATNYLVVTVGATTATQVTISVNKFVAGVSSSLGTATVSGWVASTYHTLRVVIDTAGRFSIYHALRGNAMALVLRGVDTALATGGTLASGKPGFHDINTSATAATRNYDNFGAWAQPSDAALFASQSLEIRHDRVIREDSTGTLWQAPSKYEGDLLRIPPAGREARSARFIVKASRNDPDSGPDSAIDDITAQLTYTPRYLHLPG